MLQPPFFLSSYIQVRSLLDFRSYFFLVPFSESKSFFKVIKKVGPIVLFKSGSGVRSQHLTYQHLMSNVETPFLPQPFPDLFSVS